MLELLLYLSPNDRISLNHHGVDLAFCGGFLRYGFQPLAAFLPSRIAYLAKPLLYQTHFQAHRFADPIEMDVAKMKGRVPARLLAS
jgi:hypothetical protein